MSLHRTPAPTAVNGGRFVTDRRDFMRMLGAGTGLVLLPALAGCGDSGSSTSGSSKGSKRFDWQAIPAYSLQSSDPARAKYVQKQIDAFKKSSGYDVNPLVASADITAAMAKLLQQASQHRAPSVAQVDSYIFPRFIDYSSSVAASLKKAGLSLDDWLPPFRKGMAKNGTPMGMQFTTDVRALFYRKDIIDSPPTTFDDVIAVGQKLKAKGKSFVFPAGRGEGAISCTLWPEYWATGNEIVTNGKPSFASGAAYDAMLAVLSHIQNCISTGITPKSVATYAQEDDQLKDVATGQAGMFIGGNWQVAQLAKITPGGNFAEQWGVAPIPNAAGRDFATVAGGWMWAFFDADATVRDAAADFIINGWVSDEGMAEWCNIGGYLPPRQSVFDNPAYKGNSFTADFRKYLRDYAQERPADPVYQDISTAMQVALSSVASGQQGPKQALDAALRQIG